MGIYDRDYYREEEPRGFFLGGERGVVTNLILLNLAIWLVDLFTVKQNGLSSLMRVTVGTLYEPVHWWKFLTAGFAHDPRSFWHVAFNMLGLYVFGSEVERVRGRREFLALYLVMLVLSTIGWAATASWQGVDPEQPMLGASGAVCGLLVIFACMFPHRTLFVSFVIPVPAWLAAALMVAADVAGFVHPNAPIAYAAHLTGAAFGAAYYLSHWTICNWIPDWLSLSAMRRRARQLNRPKFRVVNPEMEEHEMQERLDEVLEKYHREGEGSLTRQEREFLEEASRRIREKLR